MSSFYATDFMREFELRLILGSLDAAPVWEGECWNKFVDAIAPLVELGRAPAATEGAYFLRAGNKGRTVGFKFGNWREAPPPEGVFATWELLCPSDRRCTREQRTPDFYSSVSHDRAISMCDLRYGAVIVLALGADCPNSLTLIDAATDEISRLVRARLVAKKRRTWGFPTEVGYNEGISETSWLRGGMAGREPDANMLHEPWDQVTFVRPTG